MTHSELAHRLRQLEGKPYPAYKGLRGRYSFPHFELSIDRVQGDPFAAPSRLSLVLPHSESQIPVSLYHNRPRRIGAENFQAIAFHQASRQIASRSGSGKSGLIGIDAPGQEVLERSCVSIGPSATTIRFSVGLPANGRRIMGRAAAALLTEYLPEVVSRSLLPPKLDTLALQSFAQTNEEAEALRAALAAHRLIAFVADGAVLPRASGIDPRPLSGAVPFQSPDSLRVKLELPSGASVSGMGLPEGLTLIVGGGYHGKSTLLAAIERGVYNHRPGDGRERVVTRADAYKARAEDGRSVAGVDLSAFINNLPGDKSTTAFTSADASGSTSQAANIIEALEVGCKTLLLDEDISATNFLIRDERMAQLIAAEKEPITPFVRRVRQLHEQHGVSTILVLGGSGDYFAPAHRVIAMDNFRPLDVTKKAKDLSAQAPLETEPFDLPRQARQADPSSLSPYRQAAPYRGSNSRSSERSARPRANVKARDKRTLSFGEEEIDLSLVAQIVDPAQTRAIGAALAYACKQDLFASHSIAETCARLAQQIDTEGLAFLDADDLAAIRPLELAAAINRLRSLRIRGH